MQRLQLRITFILLVLLLTVTLIPTATAASWDLQFRKRLPRPLGERPHLDTLNLKQWLVNQLPLQAGAAAPAIMGSSSNPSTNAVLPPEDDNNNSNSPKHAGGNTDENGIILSDVLPKARGVNVFASLTRQFESVEARLDDAAHNVTVLAPRNSAIQELPRKPWENPDDIARFGEQQAYEGQEGQDRATRNLERFVKAHVVATSPWKEGEEAETLAGDKLTWARVGDKIRVGLLNCLPCWGWANFGVG
ncbi:hypothetical protein BO86DRAFT_389819 [Aspergillus japonicus CBS 114.51]|uniref:FAS1 domain-containing protein n=1 Tax=Aspergillus japonicus CBS 114.51 TaxID=1448312 RepID=A0A8T8WZK4_ASPJA|nr:hypothetical protein BO86DRAFT_389819 [Aspergillus japonicus CBS 114.51]RAH81094.1 hypothetical protein BO86DRAFT_389819 [Aspergillus japonicus CBS 114.51]